MVENFSGIVVEDVENALIAEGWMEFIETESGLEVFWWFLYGASDYAILEKTTSTVARHVWDRLSPEVRDVWKAYAP